MTAVGQHAADLVAYVNTLDPDEAMHELQHTLDRLVRLLSAAGEKSLRVESVCNVAVVVTALASGMVEQIATKPGGVRPVACQGGEETAVGLFVKRALTFVGEG